MTKPHEAWTVLPHGALEPLTEDVYTVTGQLRMPLGETTRRMTVIRLTDRRLVIYSAMALSEQEMQKLEALGQPTFLVVPSDIHRMDIKGWKARYPSLRVIAPSGAREKVSELVPIDSTQADFGDDRVKLFVVPGTREKEFAMTVRSSDGTTLIVNDLIFNLPEIPGIAGFGLRLLGFGPGRPCMPKLVTMKLVDDRTAVREQLDAWAAQPDLSRLVVSHGAPIEQPRETLRRLAGALA